MLDGISRAGRADSQWLSDAVSALFEAAHLRRQLRRLQHPTCTQERSGRENRNRSGARKVGASTVAFARSPATWSCENQRCATPFWLLRRLRPDVLKQAFLAL